MFVVDEVRKSLRSGSGKVHCIERRNDPRGRPGRENGHHVADLIGVETVNKSHRDGSKCEINSEYPGGSERWEE